MTGLMHVYGLVVVITAVNGKFSSLNNSSVNITQATYILDLVVMLLCLNGGQNIDVNVLWIQRISDRDSEYLGQYFVVVF